MQSRSTLSFLTSEESEEIGLTKWNGQCVQVKLISFSSSGYSVGSLISSRGSQLYVAGAPRFNHTGKVIIFTLKNSGDLTIWHALLGEQVCFNH